MCTRVLWNEKRRNEAVVVGRSMDWDWDKPNHANLWLLPRGMKRNGGVTSKSKKWTSKYGSLVATMSWVAENRRRVTVSADGMNEKRLAGHLLWLPDAGYGTIDEAKRTL